jgi:hypothetical protein
MGMYMNFGLEQKKRRDAIHSPKRADHVSPFSARDFELGRRVRLMRTNLPVEG